MSQALGSFHALALLEASRLEEQGDMAGAWTWHRAALRATYHTSLRATCFGRMSAGRRNGVILRRVSAWAVDPRTTPALIRGALDDAVACGTFTPSEEYSFKAGTPLALDGPENPGHQLLIARLTSALSSQAYRLDSDQARTIADAWRFWRREPERSRRVMRLVVANRLAYLDLPPDRRPAPDPGVSGPFELYALGPESPANARVLSPADLDRWLRTAIDAQELLRGWDSGMRSLRLRERANHRALVTLLAGELYRRDHGTNPPTDEALVGPYLKELPDDGLGDARDSSSQPAGSAVQ
jgi:hypothetical protein